MNVDETKSKPADVIWFKRKRYYVILLTFFGAFLAILLRLNLSIAIVEMTTERNVTIGNRTYTKKDFEWNNFEKGFILSSFSWGYFFSIVGGVLACKYGGTNVFALGLLVTALLTLLTPPLIQFSTTAYVISRICEGFAESFSVAAMTDIFVFWTPLNERSRLTNFANTGTYLAPALSYPICGYLTKFYGWQTLFYITGASVIPWFFIWWILVPRYPTRDRFILTAEKDYLMEAINVSAQYDIDFPWKKIFTSKSVYALGFGRFVEAWYFAFVVYCLPIYIKDMQNINIEEIGLVSAIPHIACGTGLFLASFIADYIRNHQICGLSTMYKIFVTYSHTVALITTIVLISSSNFFVSILCLSMQRFSYGFANSCYCVLPADIGRRYSSLVNGFAITCISMGHILSPLTMGLMVPNRTVTEWNRYFLVLCAVSVCGMVIFCLFGSGETEPWAKSETEDSGKTKMKTCKK